MTYCVAMKLKNGILFGSDTRTNAGVDQVATVSKMHILESKQKKITIVMLSAGNLSLSQLVVERLKQNTKGKDKLKNIFMAKNMHEAVSIVGREIRSIHKDNADHLKNHNVDFNLSLIVGGQIGKEEPRLFNMYSAGNFIEATTETPYFQIGETKYGKPIIDRVLNNHLSEKEAIKCLLVSFDSTIKSNISVGTPIDLFFYKQNSFSSKGKYRVVEGDEYFENIKQSWSDGIRSLFNQLP
ncbi:MAG: peptidase [Methylophilaceae bacterium]